MRTRKYYTKQFKLDAVRLLEQTDKPAAELIKQHLFRKSGAPSVGV